VLPCRDRSVDARGLSRFLLRGNPPGSRIAQSLPPHLYADVRHELPSHSAGWDLLERTSGLVYRQPDHPVVVDGHCNGSCRAGVLGRATRATNLGPPRLQASDGYGNPRADGALTVSSWTDPHPPLMPAPDQVGGRLQRASSSSLQAWVPAFASLSRGRADWCQA